MHERHARQVLDREQRAVAGEEVRRAHRVDRVAQDLARVLAPGSGSGRRTCARRSGRARRRPGPRRFEAKRRCRGASATKPAMPRPQPAQRDGTAAPTTVSRTAGTSPASWWATTSSCSNTACSRGRISWPASLGTRPPRTRRKSSRSSRASSERDELADGGGRHRQLGRRGHEAAEAGRRLDGLQGLERRDHGGRRRRFGEAG